MTEKIASEIITLERRFEVIIQADEDGMYVASVPELEGCHTQARALNDLRDRICKVVVLYLDEMPNRLQMDMAYKKK